MFGALKFDSSLVLSKINKYTLSSLNDRIGVPPPLISCASHMENSTATTDVMGNEESGKSRNVGKSRSMGKKEAGREGQEWTGNKGGKERRGRQDRG